MGRRGKAPTPTAILKARGNPRAGANGAEPRPELGAPPRPRKLNSQAARVWDAVIAVVAAGVLSRDNGQSLAKYAHGVARWWKLAEWLDANDEVYEVVDNLGNVKFQRHPNLITYERLGRDLLRMEQEFGLTPASRTRIHAIAIAGPSAGAPPRPAGVPTLRIAQ